MVYKLSIQYLQQESTEKKKQIQHFLCLHEYWLTVQMSVMKTGERRGVGAQVSMQIKSRKHRGEVEISYRVILSILTLTLTVNLCIYMRHFELENSLLLIKGL